MVQILRSRSVKPQLVGRLRTMGKAAGIVCSSATRAFAKFTLTVSIPLMVGIGGTAVLSSALTGCSSCSDKGAVLYTVSSDASSSSDTVVSSSLCPAPEERVSGIGPDNSYSLNVGDKLNLTGNRYIEFEGVVDGKTVFHVYNKTTNELIRVVKLGEEDKLFFENGEFLEVCTIGLNSVMFVSTKSLGEYSEPANNSDVPSNLDAGTNDSDVPSNLDAGTQDSIEEDLGSQDAFNPICEPNASVWCDGEVSSQLQKGEKLEFPDKYSIVLEDVENTSGEDFALCALYDSCGKLVGHYKFKNNTSTKILDKATGNSYLVLVGDVGIGYTFGAIWGNFTIKPGSLCE